MRSKWYQRPIRNYPIRALLYVGNWNRELLATVTRR
jgi:hypothetical protein